ncbi:hypothetical protein MLD38_013898 [Melastoma candidum]|uniref:Uncharacterized protein n=1 Tax=Melastoma candidum TaxID=119954 RepID=A0ACB9RB07_9MYRT|nr:hypothetical protein MLD38_013898 [Melastoma candidum]
MEVEVKVKVGLVDCFDCAVKKIFPPEAFLGIGVTIDCKAADQPLKARAMGMLNGEGKFWVSLPGEILLENGTLKEECFAHLHGASAKPCPPIGGIEATKIVLKSKTNDKCILGVAGELKLSPVICASTLYSWPHIRHPNIPWFLTRPKFPPPNAILCFLTTLRIP